MHQSLRVAGRNFIRTCLLRFGRVEKLVSHFLQTCKVGRAWDLRWCATSASFDTNFLLHLSIVHIFAWNVFTFESRCFPSMLESLFNKSSTLTRLYFEDIMRSLYEALINRKIQNGSFFPRTNGYRATQFRHTYFVTRKVC